MSETMTVSELKALINDLPSDRPVNITVKIDAPEHLEEQLSELRTSQDWLRAEVRAFEQENDYLRNLLFDLGIDDPDTINQARIAEVRAAVESVTYTLTPAARDVVREFRTAQ